MKFDALTSLKVVNNQRLMAATHRGEFRDLGGALALTSDLPHPRFNCLEGFTTASHRIESLLDLGFSLLRAFDRPAAARLSPLDRPLDVAQHLERRGLIEASRDIAMVLGDTAPSAPPPSDVRIVRCDPENAAAWAALHVQAAGLPAYVKPHVVNTALANVLDPDHALYIAEIDGQFAGTLLSVREGDTTGIYSVATLKAYRRRGLATALTRRAIVDAQAAGATCICLETDATNFTALALYEALGFRPVHESSLWVERSG